MRILKELKAMTAPTVGSLFSGIGGIDLAFQRNGFDIAFQVEIDPYCRKVLAKHWPDVPRFEDVKHVGIGNLPTCDVLAGGFPCTNLSLAGKQEGIKVGNASGLWFEFARIIGELRPRVVFLENVPAITHNGGTTVIGQLTEMGYDAEWCVVPASAVGAPHRRNRWFCVAYTDRYGRQEPRTGQSHNDAQWDNGKGATFHIQHSEWHENPVLDGMRELGIQGHRSWEKHIPAEYMTADVNLRLELLRGLMDTDGTCKKNGSAVYTTVSKQLAADVVSLVRSLGGLTSMSIDYPTFMYKGELRTGRPRHNISVMMDQNPFKLERKAARWHHKRALRRWIVSIEPSVEDYCTCITVAAENGLFVTDHYVVTHNSQAIRTHSKSLMFVQLHKDSSWMRPALADYILLFRKPGETPVPITTDVTNEEWIQFARPIWYGIRESDTLNVASARSADDERHIAPLQLETIERCIRLWSNKGDLILTPFLGIGSEVYTAVKFGRRGVGIELKREYFAQAVKNIRRAENEKSHATLWDLIPDAGVGNDGSAAR
jgi:DNA-cytosine methyltransferase